MKYIIVLFLAFTSMMAGDTQPYLLKKIVSGGNGNATLGQVVAGYKNGYHVGIRTPRVLTTSVNEPIPMELSGLAFPNPTSDGIVRIDVPNPMRIEVSDLNGFTIGNGIDLLSKQIQLPYRGSFFVRVITTDNQVYKTIVIFN